MYVLCGRAYVDCLDNILSGLVAGPSVSSTGEGILCMRLGASEYCASFCNEKELRLSKGCKDC